MFVTIIGLGQVMPEDSPAEFVWLLGGSAIPISIGVAVTRYRLYEIDRILSRGLAYGLVVVLLGSVFAVGVVAVPNLVIGTGSAPALAVATSTLIVAALFNPVRKRALAWVDRRFNRSRYDAEQVMSAFSDTLRNRIETEDLVGGWVDVVSSDDGAVGPRGLGETLSRPVRWALWGWTATASAAWIGAWFDYPDKVIEFGIPAILFLVVGSLLTIRVRGNLIGPVLVIGASAWLIYDIGRAYATASLERGPFPLEHLAAWLGAWTGPVAFLMVPVLLTLFPDGRFSGRRRWFLAPFGLVIGLVLVGRGDALGCSCRCPRR